mmetsp:Transcript_19033/g.29718  ORF Transcript_19033/g.29718 Transcript_19033/m.29718 type:complete len:106 (-) Transcript_19033:174-491(-)
MLTSEDLKLKTTLEKTEMLVDEYCRYSFHERTSSEESSKKPNPFISPLQAFLRAGSLFVMSGLGPQASDISEQPFQAEKFGYNSHGTLSPCLQSGCSTPRGGIIV